MELGRGVPGVEMVIFMNFQKNFMLDLMQTLLWYEPQLSSNPLGFLNYELYNVAGSSYDDWWFHSPDLDHQQLGFQNHRSHHV